MNKLFTNARAQLILTQPFFGTLCLRLKPVEDETMETGATDGVHLFYNPVWFEKLQPLERIGFLAHEVMHVVLMHIGRRQERQPQKWNVACDYAENYLLKQSNFILPKGALLDDQYNDMSAEEIYNLLPAPPDGWESLPADFGACGGVLDHPETLPNGELPGSVEANLTVAINQAAEAARQAGKLPGGLESVLGDLNDPKVCWKHVLARFLRTNNSSDFSWQKPNRRFIADGLYLPSMYNPVIEEIAVISDTSGSRTDEELNQDLAEISSIILDVNPNKVHFVEVDTEVQNYTEYTRESLPIKMTMTGRGGTCFSPGIEYINQNYPNVSALVYLTDLGSNDFGEQPSYPVLWITTHQGETPYGEIIKI